MKLLNLCAILLCLQFLACNAPSYPEFREMKNVKFKSISFTDGLSITFQGEAVFFNPNAIGANVTEVNLDVYINKKKVTNIKQDVRAEMNARSEFTLPLNFDVPLKEVYQDIKPTIGSIFKKRKLDYRMDGTLKVGLGSVEFAVPIDFAGEEEIKF